MGVRFKEVVFRQDLPSLRVFPESLAWKKRHRGRDQFRRTGQVRVPGGSTIAEKRFSWAGSTRGSLGEKGYSGDRPRKKNLFVKGSRGGKMIRFGKRRRRGPRLHPPESVVSMFPGETRSGLFWQGPLR